MVPSSFSIRSRALVVGAALLLGFQALAGSTAAPSGPLASNADLSISSVIALPAPNVMVGSNITYTINFVNNGPDAAVTACVKNIVPANTTFVSRRVVTGSGWNATSTPPVGGTGDVIWQKDTPGPASGETAQFEVVVKVNTSTPHYTTITDTAGTYPVDGETVDGISSNNSKTATTKAIVIVDPLEPNDTPATATVLPMGTTADLIYSANADEGTYDIDWYKFFVPPADAGKDLKVNVKNTSPYPDPQPAGWRSDVDFDVLDATLTDLALAYSASDDETLYLHNVASGWYYINLLYGETVYADSVGWARYAITIETGTNFGVGYVTGRVLNGNSQGVANVWVGVQTYPRNWNISFVTGNTAADGTFCVATPPGTFDVLFTGDGTMSVNHPTVNVVDEFYSDKPSLATADHISVAGAQTLNLGDVTMDVGATVTGQVTNGSTPLSNVTVWGYDLAGNSMGSVYTDSGGNYSINRLPAGGAKLYFTKSGYAGEYYDDQPALGPATTLPTVAGGTITGINAVLGAGGIISGTVTDVLGAGVSVTVKLYSVLDGTFARSTLTSTAGTGAYSFNRVKPGNYKVFFNATGTGNAPEWYNNSASFAGASPVTVVAGVTTGNINVVLARTGGGDFTGDLKADILWRHTGSGDVWLWPMNGAARTAETYVRTVADTNFEIRGVADFDGNGSADIVWRNKVNGQIYIWPMNGTTPVSETYVATVDPAYDIVGTGDYDGNGKADLLWRHLANGELWFWSMNGTTPYSQDYVATVDPGYEVVGSGDLNGDGLCDAVWRHKTTGEVWTWIVSDTDPPAEVWVATVPDTGYMIVGVADFTGDSKADLLWHHATRGEVWMWTMNGATRVSETWVATVPDTGYRIVGTRDYDGDRKADILWHHATRGEVWVWLMNGTTRLSETWVATVPDTGYQIVK